MKNSPKSISISALLAILLIPSISSASSSYDSTITTINELLTSGNSSKALTMSKKLIANNPKRWEGYRCAAKADFFLGNANEALGYIRSAIERAPEATKAALKLGEQEILVLRDFNVAVASGKEKQNYGQYSASAIDFAKAFHTMPQKVAIGILSADMYHAAKDLTGEKAMLQEVCGRPEVSKTLQEQLLARLQTLVKLEGEQKEKELAKQKELDEQNRRAEAEKAAKEEADRRSTEDKERKVQQDQAKKREIARLEARVREDRAAEKVAQASFNTANDTRDARNKDFDSAHSNVESAQQSVDSAQANVDYWQAKYDAATTSLEQLAILYSLNKAKDPLIRAQNELEGAQRVEKTAQRDLRKAELSLSEARQALREAQQKTRESEDQLASARADNNLDPLAVDYIEPFGFKIASACLNQLAHSVHEVSPQEIRVSLSRQVTV